MINNQEKRLSLFSFGLGLSALIHGDPSVVLAVGPTQSVAPNELASPIASVGEIDPADIFERLVQNSTISAISEAPPRCNKCSQNRSRLCTHNSLILLSLGQMLKNEDYIPPALDATTSILNDKDTNLDDIEMIYSNRRNSLVVGLNAALGRPYTPSRKNSTFSIGSTAASFHHGDGPVSPPKLTSSRSLLSFYSYADMINNDEITKRPSFRLLMSQTNVPTMHKKKALLSRVPTLSSLRKGPNLVLRHVLLKDRSQNENRHSYLISPDSSDSEDAKSYRPQSPRKLILLVTDNDNESLVSSSIGECIRRTTTEIINN